MIVDDLWTDKGSETVWNETFSSPYQLWDDELKTLRLERVLPKAPTIDIWKSSYDLGAACLRQRRFSLSITRLENGAPLALGRVFTRYFKFMRLMEVGQSIVPTLDIDLAWHTHQLSPKQYRTWCVKNFGRAIDHDDSISLESNFGELFRETCIIWRKVYAEEYTTGKGSIDAGNCSGGTVTQCKSN
jgi:hypothetical protein